MAFVYMSHLAEEGQKKQDLANSIVMHQTFKNFRCSHMTLKISEEFLQQANIKIGMQLEVGYDPESNRWKVFTVHRGGYELKPAAANKAILRWPYFEGMPVLNKTSQTCRLRAASVEVSHHEFMFALEAPMIDEEEVMADAAMQMQDSVQVDEPALPYEEDIEYDPSMTLGNLAVMFDEYRQERNFNAGDRGVKYPRSLKRLASAKAASVGHRRVANDLRLTEASVRRWMTQYPMAKQIVIRRPRQEMN